MDEQGIDAALKRAEEGLRSGRGLRGTGFWKAVDVVRRDPALAERYAGRIGIIDRRAFESAVRLRVPLALGLGALLILVIIGAVAIAAVLRATGTGSGSAELWSEIPRVDVYSWPGFVPIAFLVGLGALVIGTHSLTHWVVGRAMGIRFTHVFLGGPPPPRPGVKSDYATYLRASPRARAFMHASGALITKVVPFALLPLSLGMYDQWPWLTWILLALGVVQIATDVLFSTKVSDWMKVRRELRAGRSA